MKSLGFIYRLFIGGVSLFCLLCTISQPADAQYFKFEKNRRKVSIPFQMVKNLIIIPLEINGAGPFNFILDTGVGILLITDPALNDSLHLWDKRGIKISGFGQDTSLQAYISSALHINLSSAVSGTMRAAVLQKDAFNLSGLTGMPVYGILGYEFFSSFIVKINYDTHLITLFPNETGYISKRGYKVPITIEENKPYIKADVQVDNDTVITAKFIIDTGAGHPVSLEMLNREPFEPPEKRIRANLGIGLSGQINGYAGRIKSLKLGKYTLKKVITSFPDYADAAAKVIAVNRNGNIGNGILKRFDVIFDYNRGRLYLRPGSQFKKPFEHDMSGIEFISFGEAYRRILITRVEEGSAAADAGLREGDEIVAVNLKPVKKMGVGELDELFRSQDGRNLLLDVVLKDSTEVSQLILTLKRRI